MGGFRNETAASDTLTRLMRSVFIFHDFILPRDEQLSLSVVNFAVGRVHKRLMKAGKYELSAHGGFPDVKATAGIKRTFSNDRNL